jgi:hypothetical protein
MNIFISAFITSFLLLISIFYSTKLVSKSRNTITIGNGKCNCINKDSVLFFIENFDTLKINDNFLLSTKLKYSNNDSLDVVIANINQPLFNDKVYCYSEKYMLKNGNYIIQIISNSGFTNQYLLWDSKNKESKLYTIAWMDGFDDRIWINDFKNLLKSKSSHRQMEFLDAQLSVVTKWNQKRFPVFSR